MAGSRVYQGCQFLALATRGTRASSKATQTEEASIPSQVQAPLPFYGGSHAGLDAGFVWQQLSDIQKTLGAIDAKLEQNQRADAQLESELGKVKTTVSEFKQIQHTAKVVAWIVGFFLTVILAIAGFLAKETWGVLKGFAIEQIQQKTQPPSGQP